MHHIRECLPDIKSKIIQLLQKHRAELQELGDPVDGDEDTLVWKKQNKNKKQKTNKTKQTRPKKTQKNPFHDDSSSCSSSSH
jgi:hypothetical protein